MVKQAGSVKQTRSPWRAVSVICTSASCDPARALKGRRFLGADAPRLPLAECPTPAACPCVYRKYADRRAGPRREEDQTGLRRALSSADQERRRKRGRRSTDE
jgi:hypothetical protein